MVHVPGAAWRVQHKTGQNPVADIAQRSGT